MPRVLHVIEALFRGGGAEQALANLLPELKRVGVETEVVALWPRHDVAEELEAAGIPVHRLELSYAKRWSPRVQLELANVVAGSRPDIVHAHLFFSGIHVAALPRAFPHRRVITFHNVDYEVEPSITLAHHARKYLHGLLLRNRMDAYVAVSATVARHFERHLGLRNVDVIPNALPIHRIGEIPEEIRMRTRAELGIGDGQNLLLMPGRFVKQKGHKVLLAALELLRTRGLRPRLVAVGSGLLKDEVARAVRDAGLEDQVRLHDVVPNERLLEMMGSADLVVVPSLQEGFGIVAAETMALGAPLLATSIGPIAEFVTHRATGYLVPPGEPSALADAISTLLGDAELCRRMGAAARKHVVENFSATSVAARWARKYEAILTSEANPRSSQAPS